MEAKKKKVTISDFNYSSSKASGAKGSKSLKTVTKKAIFEKAGKEVSKGNERKQENLNEEQQQIKLALKKKYGESLEPIMQYLREIMVEHDRALAFINEMVRPKVKSAELPVATVNPEKAEDDGMIKLASKTHFVPEPK